MINGQLFIDNKWHINTKLKYNIDEIENILNLLLDKKKIKNNIFN